MNGAIHTFPNFFFMFFADSSECASVFAMLMFIFFFFLLVEADFVGAELQNVCFVGSNFTNVTSFLMLA